MLKRGARKLIERLGRTRAGKLVLWKALPACGVERLVLRTDDGTFMVSTGDNMIALMLFVDGNFDKHLVEQSCSMASSYLGRSDLIYVDVGANIGSNTVYALRDPAFAAAVCFEPEATNYSNLIQTIQLSGVADQVRCVRTGLGDAIGQARLELSTINFGDHQIVPEQSSRYLSESIAITTLDASLYDEEVERVGLVCVDVQGYEAQVLGGSSILLGRDIPFLCEVNPDQLRRCGRYDRFFESAELSFNFFIDMKDPTRQRGIGELRDCANRLGAGGHTDVFLTKRSS